MKQFKKDVPLYLNSFCVGYLGFNNEIGIIEVLLVVIAGVTLVWYGYNSK